MKLNKILLTICFSFLSSLFLFDQAKATSTPPVGDVADFTPWSNWPNWIIRYGTETGRGQVFKTSGNSSAIQTVGLKLCRRVDFTKPKTLTLCSSAQNGYYAGCSNPIANKTYTASELNAMIPYDASGCPGLYEGGNDNGLYFKWVYFTFDNAVSINSSTSYFFLLGGSSSADNEYDSVLESMSNNCNWNGSSADYTDGQSYYYSGATRHADSLGAVCDILFKVFSGDPDPTPFAITDPQYDDPYEKETWVTVTGTCPTDGTNQIALTTNCYSFDNLNYDVNCTSNTFSGQIYMDGSKNQIAAVDKSSTARDCVAYDNLMDSVSVRGIEIIEGYPDDWYFNFSYYDDYDITIKKPSFETSLILPASSTNSNFTFAFTYPASSSPSNLNFHISQYDKNGILLNGNYYDKKLDQMTDTQNHIVGMSASSTQTLHYVVQLTENGEMKRQYPFFIIVSELDFVFNNDDTGFLFPRLIKELKKKAVFNYFFTFYDGFYNLFNGQSSYATNTAMDISLKSMSDDGKYDLEMKIFSFSDPIVKKFSDGLRPYITAFLWLIFALYVVLRIARLFHNHS